MNKKEIAKRLITLRGKEKRKTIADAIGVCQSTYAMYELGQRTPSDEIKKKIADYHKTTVQAIFFD